MLPSIHIRRTRPLSKIHFTHFLNLLILLRNFPVENRKYYEYSAHQVVQFGSQAHAPITLTADKSNGTAHGDSVRLDVKSNSGVEHTIARTCRVG